MADTSLEVQAGGGTKIDMRSEATNGELRQVMVIGDPLINAGVAAVDSTNGLSVNVTNASLTIGSHPVTNAGTFAVQVSAALPAGTNAIGKLADNSGVDIGDVDITSVTPGTAAASLGKAEDAAHSSGDVGVMALSVRQDTATALAGTDADYQPLITDGNGRLHVNVGNTLTVGAHAVTNAGTFAVQDVPTTSGGCANYSALSTAAVLAAEIKGSAGQVYDIQCFNNGANEVFIRLYNQTGSPAAGDTANIIWRGMIPGNAAAAGFSVNFPKGRACGTGIGVRVTAAVADNDNTALSANEVMVNIGYK